MLTEFAFTPSIFDEDAHEDKDAWKDQLRELVSSMFPRTSAWPVIVSDLYAGSWSSHVVPHVDRIQDHRARKYCQDLLTNMQRMLVVRPDIGEWPYEDDVAWCREAVATNEIEPIDRIVSVKATKDAMAAEFALIRSIDEVKDSGFWRGIESGASPRMVIAEQVDLLRKLCLHSEWVALIDPYGFTSEQNFSLKLLEIVLNRHASFGPIHFELHAQGPDVTDPVERQERQQSVANYMASQIQPKLTGSSSVELYFWPSLRERILVAGNYFQQSGGQKRKSPRWGVGIQHVAHGSDGESDDTEWKLLRRNSLDTWFRRIAAENATGKPTPTVINPAT